MLIGGGGHWLLLVDGGMGGHSLPLVGGAGACAWGCGHRSWVLVVGGYGSLVAVVAEGGGSRLFMGGWHGCSSSPTLIWGQAC